MRFHVLGPFGVTAGDETIALGSPQQQKLLAVLCASPNSAVSSDRLVDEIWGDTPPPSADHLVQVYVSRLRAVLGEFDGESRIVRQGAGYALRIESNELDSTELEALTERGLHLIEEDPGASRQLLGEATGLWHGKPYGHLADDSITLKSESARLTEVYLGALESRLETDLRLGHHQQLIGELRQLTTDHPYRERIWELLMLALYRSGRQVEALRTFQLLRHTLGEELGIEPSPTAVELEERILLQDPTLLWEAPPPPSNLPVNLTTFVGRGSEMADVSKLLETSRLVTLTGPGGIGKTRLAVETAQQIVLRFPDGIWWIDLAPITDPDTIAAEVARTLGVAAQPGTAIEQSIAQSLIRRQSLLVLDNCEHVAPAVAELAGTILHRASRMRVLATSRRPLHITGETVWTVPALSMPFEDIAVNEVPHSDAIRLFVDRAAAAQPHFALDSDNAPQIVEICRRVDGMPLAIEMAAARLRVLSPTEIAASLENRFEFLRRLEADVVPRHETLQAAIDWSYELLQPHLQNAFNSLAVFPGAFDLDTAAGVVFRNADAEPLQAITDLVDASMIGRVGDTDSTSRFRLLETLRAYGTERLRERGDLDTMRTTHATYFLGLVASADDTIGEPEFARWMERFDRCYDDIQQSLGWSLEHRPRVDALRAAPVLQHYWYRTGDAREAMRWGLRMVADGEAVPNRLVAAAHAAISFGATILGGDPSIAIEHADRAIELHQNSPNHRDLVTALFGRANAALLVGDFDTIKTTSRTALDLCDEISYPWGRAGSLGTMSFAHFFGGGSLDEAIALAKEAVALYRQVDDVASQIVINPVSAIALQQGDLATAERFASDAAAIASGSGWEATALTNLAEVMIAKGAFDSAQAMLQRAVTRALDTGLENWLRVAVRDLAQVKSEYGDHEEAAVLLAASRQNMPAWGLNPMIYESVEGKSRTALGEAAFTEATKTGQAIELDELIERILPG